MPYINIKITREGTTAEQKAELIKGATELLARVLNKNPKTTVVTIEEVDTDSWGIGGDPVEIAREKEKLRVAEIEKLKLSKDALVRELAELKGIPFALAAEDIL
ncbi:tautomerase family protein [Dialister invisus]|uniref:tautomerase family protein n=1 Tax=Dialister invisus TaxID=218538 RepID=UPI00265E59A0|nr:4-oxalocrotonate tautomerase family protein [Dialister invisus]